MRTRDNQCIQSLLSTEPLINARSFTDAAQEVLATEEIGSTSTDRHGVIRRHVERLDEPSQHMILALPEALVGLKICGGTPVPQRVLEWAEELAYWSVNGMKFGSERVFDGGTWLSESLSLLALPWTNSGLKMPTLAEQFFGSIVALSEITPSLRFRNVYGFIYPDFESMDDIFRRLNASARRAGGKKILSWIAKASSKSENTVPLKNMALSYAVKHIRKKAASSPKALAEFRDLCSNLQSLLRFDDIRRIGFGVKWTIPALLLEEVTKTVLESALQEYKYRFGAELEFADYIAKASSREIHGWDKAKRMFRQPSRRIHTAEVDERALASWTYRSPLPCASYGMSLRSTFGSDLGRRPLVSLGSGRLLVAPQPSNSELAWEVQERAGLRRNELARLFERFVVEKLSHMDGVISGEYRLPGSSTRSRALGEIDCMIVGQNGECLAVIECKARSEIPTKWRGSHHAMLEFLQRGIFKSQEQLLRFEARLAENGSLAINNGGAQEAVRYAPGVLRVSISMRDYGELHRPGYAEAMMSHLCSISISTSPSSQIESIFDNLKQNVITYLETLRRCGVENRDALSRTVVLDLGLFVGIARRSRTPIDFIDILRSAIEAKQNIGRIGY